MQSFTTCNQISCVLRAEDPELQEFLRVMQPRQKGAIWANDDTAQDTPAMNGRPAKQPKSEELSSDEEYYSDGPSQQPAAKSGRKTSAKGKSSRKAASAPESSASEGEGSAIFVLV